MELAGWGRYPKHETELLEPSAPSSLPMLLAGREGVVARGNGRAYGDAAIGERCTLSLRGLDRMRAFDPATGHLTVEAGVLLADILEAFPCPTRSSASSASSGSRLGPRSTSGMRAW
jgi:decaprenylphospho-beta-D-ribofuranose 2-oxidase